MQSQWCANEADLRFQYSRKVTAVKKEVTFIEQKFHYEGYYIGTRAQAQGDLDLQYYSAKR